MTLRSWLSGIRSRITLKSRATRRSPQPQRTASAAEVLEIRQIPTTAVLQLGVLTITGSDQADNIVVTKSGANIRVSGVATTFAASKVTSVVVNAGGGDDTVDLGAVTVSTTVFGGAGNDVLIGGSGKDSLKGETGNDVLRGNGGNDVLDGGADLDSIRESANANFVLTNVLLTGVGTDTLESIETASLQGGAGNNRLDASKFSGSVTLDGAAGNDALMGGNSNDSLIGGAGNDSLIGNAGDDVLEGGAGNDSLNGGDGDDRFVFSGSGVLGTDTIAVGDNLGVNTLDFSALGVGITRLDLGQTISQTVALKSTTTHLKLTLGSADAIDNVFGTNFSDLIFGNELSNSLIGRGGNDTLAGNAGNDLLDGGLGADSLDAHAGDDTLLGGDGDDTLVTGMGVDSADGGQGIDTINGVPEVVGYAMAEILDAYNTGRVNFQSIAQFIVDNGLGKDLPVVQKSVGAVLDVVSKLQTVFNQALSGTQEQIAAAVNALESLGFRLEYVGTQADANGDLLRISYDRTINTDQARFNVAGDTGFSYFDGDVNGQLSGSFKAQAPTVNVHVTFGVDLVGGTPTFYVADSSNVSFTGLNGSGSVSGEMAIRYLAGVQATGTLTVNLDGRLGLRDSDSDHKLRLTDFSNAASVVGDVDGSVVLNVDMNTNLPVLRNLTWHGDWRADIVDGHVNVGTPTLRTPSVEDVTAALLNSFVDMKNNFSFLGPIGDVINTKLDVLNKSVGDLTGVGDKLGWLNGSVSAAKEQLRSLGVEIIDLDLNTITSLISGQRVDLIKFHTKHSAELFSKHGSFPMAAAPIGPFVVTVSGSVDAELGWEYEAGFGVDTTGVWIDPRTHISLYGGVSAGVEASVTFAGILGLNLSTGAGVQVFAGIGLRDPDASDGRIYMDEIFAGVGDSRTLGQAIVDVMKIDTRLEVEGYARAELDLPWPLPNITLFDTSFKLGDIASQHQEPTTDPSSNTFKSLRRIPLAGQGERALPATLLADGTLVITGTADRDYVGLKGRDGTVEVKWSGYRNGHFTGVKKVVFNGGDEDDNLTVDEAFNIPIEANGEGGDDYLMGSSANDTLDGGAGNDDLQGRAGNDLINAGEGNDNVDGGTGDDTLNGGSDRDVLLGGAGHDRINGQDGIDAIEGGAGNDTLSGGNDFDAIYGGSGNDVLDGDAGNDNLAGEEGHDTLRGGIGDDVLRGGVGDDQLSGGDGDDLMFGDEGQDVLNGDDGADILLGGADNDGINGGKGNDLVRGEAGDDELYGSLESDNVVDEDDVDTLQGGEGTDTLRGGRGSDYLNGDEGQDDVNGEVGTDIIIIDLSTSVGSIEDLVAGGVDRDTLWISPAYLQSNDIEATAQKGLSAALDQVTSNDGQQEFDPNTLGQLVADAYQRGTGDNELHLTQLDADDFLVEQFDPVTHQLVASMTFTLTGGAQTDLETITMAGMDGNDTLFVSANTTRDVVLDGGDGNDTLSGGAGRDILRGQAGNDSLIGNANGDELHGGDGDDTLEGGDGSDRLYGEDGDDSMDGGTGRDYQVGGAGNDRLVAGQGPFGDVMDGGADDDTLEGGNGVDFIQGGEGDDSISGGAMGDFLDGNGGNDIIIGGNGADIIFGGEGNDFVIAGTTETETTRSSSDWLAQELQVRADLTRLNADIIAKTEEVEMLRAIPLDQRTDDDVARLALAAQDELDLRTWEDQLSDVKRELNRERGAFLVDELNKAGIVLNYQAVFQDVVIGGDGNDTLKGSAFQDLLIGGAGDDEFRHSAGQDQIIGGEGKETYVLDGTNFDDTISINGVQDGTSNLAFDVNIVTKAVLMTSRISLDPDVEAIGVRGFEGIDTMTANLGQNALKDVRFEGGDGNDTIDVRGIESKATLIGGAGDDTLFGGMSDDSIDGGTGDDSILGGNGRDTLLGGTGDDVVFGEGENDKILGGDGNDTLKGGDGTDEIHGEGGNDEIWGGEKNDTLYGDAGNDSISGEGEDDKIFGGDGDDTISGDLGNDSLFGDAGDDLLLGMAGNDELHGGGGNNKLDGGANADFLDGNATEVSSNIFYFSEGGDTYQGRIGVSQEGLNDRLVYQAQPGDQIEVYDRAFIANGVVHSFAGSRNLESYEIVTEGASVNALRGIGGEAQVHGFFYGNLRIDGVNRQCREMLVTTLDGWALTINNGSNGTFNSKAIVWGNDARSSQRWIIEEMGNGLSRIISLSNDIGSWRVLTSPANNTATYGSSVQLADYNGGANQLWFLYPRQDGSTVIVSHASGLVLRAPGTHSYGSAVVLWGNDHLNPAYADERWILWGLS